MILSLSKDVAVDLQDPVQLCLIWYSSLHGESTQSFPGFLSHFPCPIVHEDFMCTFFKLQVIVKLGYYR